MTLMELLSKSPLVVELNARLEKKDLEGKEMTLSETLTKHPTYESIPGYWARHEDALAHPRNQELPLVIMLRGWLAYADMHKAQFESGIGRDSLLGPQWAVIGAALRALLNGDVGRRLDLGVLDGVLYSALQAEGFDPESL